MNALLSMLCLLLSLGFASSGAAQSAGQPAAESPAYVGSQVCADCHSAETEAWQASHHALAWRRPGDDSFVGAFQGESFTSNGLQVTFSQRDGRRMLDVAEADGSRRSYPLHSVGGVSPLEHPIVETTNGRLQSFDVVWDVDARRWYHLYPDQDLPPQDAYHWSGAYKSWNARCAECHATGFDKGFDFRRQSYRSTQVEIGVGCEACHGPGAAHLDLVAGRRAGPFQVSLDRWGFSAALADPQAAMQQCVGCHSRREAFGAGNPLPGTAFSDAYNLALLRPGLYHADGQILDEVYVYGSFLQSRMHQRGVTCSNCHDPHSAEPLAEGNAICAQCHSPAGNPDFPSLRRASYDAASHSRHPEGSTGAQCVSCHMPDQTYMGIDRRRDHSFRVPRPDLSAETGSPDACTSCHADRNSTWAADQLRTWFPQGRWQQPHYGQVLAAGRADAPRAAPQLLTLARDGDQPNLVRATALWLLGPAGDAVAVAEIAPFLDHADPLVRVGAVEALRPRAVEQTAPYLVRGLQDQTRAVRITAARAILGQRPDTLPPSLRALLGQAYRTFGGMVQNQMDFAEAHLQIAGYSMVAGNLPSAIVALAEAVRINPQNTQAWHSLIRMTAEVEGREAARSRLQQALRLNPDDAGLRDLAGQL